MARGKKISKKVKDRYKRHIQRLVNDLSRKVIVYKQSVKSECPNCYFDKMTQRSTGKCKWTAVEVEAKNDSTKYKYFIFGRCPICQGKGYLEIIRRTCVPCLITWNPSERRGGSELVYTPAGSEGSTIVRLKTDPKYFDIFKNCEKLVVDDIECKISRIPAKRGLGNESVLVVIAFTTEKQDIDSDEIIKVYYE